MKMYVITLSRKFPKGHRKEGKPTFFKEKFMFGQQCQFCPPKDRDTNYPECDECLRNCDPVKIHTIRANFGIKIDLLKLKNSFVTNLKGKAATKRCLVIPIDDAQLFLGEKGIYLNLTGVEMQGSL